MCWIGNSWLRDQYLSTLTCQISNHEVVSEEMRGQRSAGKWIGWKWAKLSHIYIKFKFYTNIFVKVHFNKHFYKKNPLLVFEPMTFRLSLIDYFALIGTHQWGHRQSLKPLIWLPASMQVLWRRRAIASLTV